MTVQTLSSTPASSASRSRSGWYLVGCLPQSRTLSQIKVDAPNFVLGRHPDLNLQVASQCVSGRHAEILQIGMHLYVRDLGSTNGTFLNRRRVEQPTPLAHGDHIELANVEFRVEYRSDDTGPHAVGIEEQKKTADAIDVMENSWVLSQFNQLMDSAAIGPHYQPLVSLRDGDACVGYEALARTKLIGLENPAALFHTAEMMNREVELSLVCRKKAVEFSRWINRGKLLFVNTHSHESLDIDVLPSLRQLRTAFPDVAVVIEIHEGAINNPRTTLDFCQQVRDLGYKVAYDDFGAGQSRLLELVKAPPDYLKFDSCLIRDVHNANPYQWRMIEMLVAMCHDVPVITVAEGVENAEEANACRDLGFDMAQGFYFGRPQPPAFYHRPERRE